MWSREASLHCGERNRIWRIGRGWRKRLARSGERGVGGNALNYARVKWLWRKGERESGG